MTRMMILTMILTISTMTMNKQKGNKTMKIANIKDMTNSKKIALTAAVMSAAGLVTGAVLKKKKIKR